MINYCKTSFVQSIFEVFFLIIFFGSGVMRKKKKWGKEVAKYQTLPLHLHLAIKSKGKIDEPSRAVLGHARSRWQAEGSWRWDGNSFFLFFLIIYFYHRWSFLMWSWKSWTHGQSEGSHGAICPSPSSGKKINFNSLDVLLVSSPPDWSLTLLLSEPSQVLAAQNVLRDQDRTTELALSY